MKGSDENPLPGLDVGQGEAANGEGPTVNVVGESAYGPGRDMDVIDAGPSRPVRRNHAPLPRWLGPPGPSWAPRFHQLMRLARSHQLVLTGLAVALLVGAGVGYLAGYHRVRLPAGARTVVSMTPSPVPPSAIHAIPSSVTGTGQRCAMQVGNQLQLGVEVINQSRTTATLVKAEATLPLGGLRATGNTWGSCGQLSPKDGSKSFSLAAGATTWLTMTFDVLVPCPTAHPVLFNLTYTLAGQVNTSSLFGFSDLGGVPYTGCSASPPYRLIISPPGRG